jgi:MFS transporter, PAT family, beta-lactamase induction signal transducer AmpG
MQTPNAISQSLYSQRMLTCVVLGFSSGLPLYLLLQLLPAWLHSYDINIKSISAFALIQLPYTWKFIWAPLADRFSLIPKFGRRRSWMLLTQIGLLVTIVAYGFYQPDFNIKSIAVISVIVAIFSASQDIAIDAFRREILSDEELGLGNSLHVNAYRVAGLIPGSLALILSDHMPWSQVFWIVALFMIPGILMTAFTKEPNRTSPPKSLKASVIEPFTEFLQRAGVKHALLVLLFIFLYKLGDSMATALATPFYLEMGYTKTEIGLIAKNAGLWPSIFGGILGGIWMLKLGINRALWIFGVIQMLVILGFAWLAHQQTLPEFNTYYFATVIDPISSIKNLSVVWVELAMAKKLAWLTLVISAEAFGVGLGTAAYVAYMARETNPMYTATQLALFTSLSAVPRTVFNAFTGVMVENLGWETFFYVCTMLALPGMALLFKVAPWKAIKQN